MKRRLIRKLIVCACLMTLSSAMAQAQKSAWRQASDAELASLLPARAQVEREHIETEMRTASGIVNSRGRYIAGVVLLTAGYSAEGKYSHYLIVQAPVRVGGIELRPGEYVFGWTRVKTGDALSVHFYAAATGRLVGSVEAVVTGLGLSEFFLGIILIPIIGNVAEHIVAVQVAVRNQMELSIEIALSSSLQIALFVAPLLVFVSLALGHPLTLVFNQLELVALFAAVLIAALVSGDGESNWLEGTALLAVYAILGIGFFLLPA